jgi:hypothetical protein
MDEDALAAIEADPALTDEVKALATAAASLDTPEIHAELKDESGVITFDALCARVKADNLNATDADVAAATIAVWIF